LFGLIVEISATDQAKMYEQNEKFYSEYTFSIGLTGFEIIEQRIENTGIVISSLFTGDSIAITTIKSEAATIKTRNTKYNLYFQDS
jgi:hypothetical protein